MRINKTEVYKLVGSLLPLLNRPTVCAHMFEMTSAMVDTKFTRCLELCAGTLFLLLLKFGAVLSIICGYEWLFDGGFLVGGDCSVLLSCGLF